jgi:hypothetical protein
MAATTGAGQGSCVNLCPGYPNKLPNRGNRTISQKTTKAKASHLSPSRKLSKNIRPHRKLTVFLKVLLRERQVVLRWKAALLTRSELVGAEVRGIVSMD